MATGLVVAGVDHSPASEAALKWAAHYARSIGARLLAVQVFPEDLPAYSFASLSGADDDRNDAYSRVTRLYASLQPEPDWRLVRVFGTPGKELVEYAEHADLLVLGTQEHVGLGRLVHGSISHYCIRHSQAPVLAYPHPSSAARRASPTTQYATALDGSGFEPKVQ